MSEFELENKKQDKRDRKDFNGTLVAVGKEDVAHVRRRMATGSNPDAVEDAKYPSGVKWMKDGWSALLLALLLQNLIIARELLAAGATVDMVMGKSRFTALMQAALNNWLDAVRLLFEFNANPNVVDKAGFTALYCAAQCGHAAMTRLLVEHGANLNVQKVNGYTALHAAAERGHIECVHILLDAGAKIDLVTKDGYTPAKLVLLFKHYPTLELLLRYGADAHLAAALPADVTIASEEEKTVVGEIVGALNRQPSFVHLLADHGGICQKEELDFQVSAHGHTQVLRVLRQVGCDAW